MAIFQNFQKYLEYLECARRYAWSKGHSFRFRSKQCGRDQNLCIVIWRQTKMCLHGEGCQKSEKKSPVFYGWPLTYCPMVLWPRFTTTRSLTWKATLGAKNKCKIEKASGLRLFFSSVILFLRNSWSNFMHRVNSNKKIQVQNASASINSI